MNRILISAFTNFLIIVIIFFISFFLVSVVLAQVQDVSQDVLIKNTDPLVAYKVVDDVRGTLASKEGIKVVGTTLKYYYVDLAKPIDDTLEEYGSNYIKPKNENKITFFPSIQFVKSIANNNWYSVNFATTSVTKFTEFLSTQGKTLLREKEWKNIAYADTGTFYPDPDTESTSFDGLVYRGGVDENFSTIRNGNGTGGNDSDDKNYSAWITGSATTDQYDYMDRSIFIFDTSSLPDDITISSSTFAFKNYSLANALGTCNIHLYYSQTSSNTGFTNSDYQDNLGKTSLGNITWSTLDANDNVAPASANYVYIDLNSYTGISPTGVTKLGMTTAWDINNDTTGLTWANSDTYVYTYFSETAGTDSDPKLIIEYTENSTSTPPTSTSSPFASSSADFNELTVITGVTEHYETSTSVPDWIEYHYYHVPFFFWVIIATITLFIFNRIIIEFLIRWRQ